MSAENAPAEPQAAGMVTAEDYRKERKAAAEKVHEAMVKVGESLLRLEKRPMPPFAKITLKRETRNLQIQLDAYRAAGGYGDTLDRVPTDGLLNPVTAGTLFDVAELENMKDFLLGGDSAKTEEKSALTALREKAHRLNPEAFSAALRSMARLAIQGSEKKEQKVTEMAKAAFAECAMPQMPPTSSTLVFQEMEKLAQDPDYITPLVPRRCGLYLGGLPAGERQTSQLEALIAIYNGLPSANDDWCKSWISTPGKAHYCQLRAL